MNMKILQCAIPGVFIIEPDAGGNRPADPWGLAELNLMCKPVQSSTSFSKKKGTIHGLHYQAEPFGEKKMIRCMLGAVFNIIVDLRMGSENYLKWISMELSDRSNKVLFVPEGLAHGFMTIRDNTEVFVEVSQFYRPQHARGIRWDDPVFGFKWPMELRAISDRDGSFPDFTPDDSWRQENVFENMTSPEDAAALTK
ncbi:MAG: dTDP-4-dehydrorhamnose 3,5-epimerase family protein [Actinomycetota bacterium]|nr:dTDP-4-dehydrorhamnose 3,5-epimerase family protein [Actinomycetota bacterium]